MHLDIEKLASRADELADAEIAMPGEFHPDWNKARDRHLAALVLTEAAKLCDQCGDQFTKTAESDPYGDGRHEQRAYGADYCADECRTLSRQITEGK